MGNHEYCPDCGESDFHYERPCNPIKKALMNRKKREAESAKQEQMEYLKNVVIPELAKLHITAEMTRLGIEVRYWNVDMEAVRGSLN